jgi:acetylornithine deacetylase/succinyl-diaminopimelate desuccinylase-like protein
MPDPADRLFALAETLVRSPSVTGETEQALQSLEEFFRRSDVPTDRLAPPGVAPSLVAGRPPRPGLPTFLLATHLDTVPMVGDPAHPPGSVDEGRLFGRGALDMKGGLALAMLLLQEFSEDPRFNLGFVATTDEEAESGGAWALLDHLPVDPDLVLVPEPTWEKVVVSASGRVVWQVGFDGKGGHGHLHGKTRPPNPLLAMAELLGTTSKDYTALKLWTEGEGEVTLPHAARLRLDRVLPEGTDRSVDQAGLERKVSAIARRYPGLQGTVGLAPRRTPWLPGYRTDPKGPWARLFVAAATHEGRRSELEHVMAVGDYNVFGSRFPTLNLGPGGGGMHGDDEWVDLISLERCWKAYRRFLLGVPADAAPPAPPAPRGKARARKG